jgi:5,10-methylene-tetrahydrofolate dehydrogenase/methenyl tetrahydrofolate cyclohydrolase
MNDFQGLGSSERRVNYTLREEVDLHRDVEAIIRVFIEDEYGKRPERFFAPCTKEMVERVCEKYSRLDEVRRSAPAG